MAILLLKLNHLCYTLINMNGVVYVSFLKLLSDLERMAARAERERIRQERYNNRIAEANRREYEKQEKIRHIESQEQKANSLTSQIINQYKNYDSFCGQILAHSQFFKFERYMKRYNEKEFEFNKSFPQKSCKSEKIKVPNESSWESKIPFLKKRRLFLQDKKQNLEQEELKKYNEDLKVYEEEKKQALKQFKEEEKKIKKDIENYNLSIEEWKNGCLNYQKESIDKFIAEILFFLNNVTKNKLINKIQYDCNGKRLIVEVFLKKEKEIFPCEGYRYYKQRDTIEPIQTKKTTINTILKELIPNVAISLIDLIFKNDELNLFDEIIVNVYFDRKCCSSIKLSKEEYNGFQLTKEDDYYYVYDHYMKNYKTLSTGVKPYDSIYIDLV